MILNAYFVLKDKQLSSNDSYGIVGGVTLIGLCIAIILMVCFKGSSRRGLVSIDTVRERGSFRVDPSTICVVSPPRLLIRTRAMIGRSIIRVVVIRMMMVVVVMPSIVPRVGIMSLCLWISPLRFRISPFRIIYPCHRHPLRCCRCSCGGRCGWSLRSVVRILAPLPCIGAVDLLNSHSIVIWQVLFRII